MVVYMALLAPFTKKNKNVLYSTDPYIFHRDTFGMVNVARGPRHINSHNFTSIHISKRQDLWAGKSGDIMLRVSVASPPWYHWPKSNNKSPGREKTHIFIVLLATAFITLCKFFTKKSPCLYKDVKYRNLFLKTRKLYSRHKMLLILPKMFFITLYVLTSREPSKNQSPPFTDLQTNWAKELFSYEYFAFSNNTCMIESNMSLYALSKLKLRNHRSFFQHVLLLSGDINLHPGPIQYPCGKCSGVFEKR